MTPLNNQNHLTGKVAVFIDAANIIYCYKDIKWKVDFKKLKKYFETKCELKGIYYYSAYFEESSGQKSFFEMLSRMGYALRLKKLKQIRNKNGTITLKGNCDTDMVVDAVATMRRYDTAVILSGDSDFVSLVNFLRGNNKTVIAISTRGHIAKDLINAVDYYFDLTLNQKLWLQ